MIRNRFAIIVTGLIVILLFPNVQLAFQKYTVETSPLACARFITATHPITLPYHVDDRMYRVSRAYMHLQQPEQFLQTFKETDCSLQVLAAGELADLAMEAGLKDLAVQTLNQAFICGKDKGLAIRLGLDGLVDRLIQLQQLDLADTVVEALPDKSSTKAHALARLADAYARTGQTSKTLSYLDRAFVHFKAANNGYLFSTTSYGTAWGFSGESMYPETKIHALARIATVYVRLGNPDEAKKTLLLAKRYPSTAVHKQDCQIHIAVAYATAGFQQESLSIAESLTGEKKIDALIHVAPALMQGGQKAIALKVAEQTILRVLSASSAYKKQVDLNPIVDLYLQADRPAQAIKVANLIKADRIYTKAAVKIADWALAHKQKNVAVPILDSTVKRVKSIVVEKREDLPKAGWDSNTGRKTYDLKTLADEYVKAGEFDKAIVAADGMVEPQEKAKKLAEVAVAMIKASPRANVSDILAKALHISKTTPEYYLDEKSDEALSSIAYGYALAGDRETATALFVEALDLVLAVKPGGYYSREAKLADLGLNFERSGIEADDRIRNVLRKFIN